MWVKEAITDGEIAALRLAAFAACNEDTCYPLWRGSSRMGNGQCFNMASWLVRRLGGHVGASRGHYAWLSPDARYVIDLTGDHHGASTYAPNAGRFHRVSAAETGRTRRFCARADRIFTGLDRLIRVGLDLAGDAYPAQEPQAQDDSDRFADSWNDLSPDQYWHDEVAPTTPEGLYQFVYANGQLEVSPNHGHAELCQHAGADPEGHTGPFAAGHVVVTNGKATWEAQSNINLHAFYRILKDATKSYGWQWGGLTDAEGQPLNETFAPKKSGRQLNYVLAGDHLYLGRTSAGDLVLSSGTAGDQGGVVTGTLDIIGNRATVSPVHEVALPQLFDWAADNGLTLYAGNDNVIKTIPDLQEGNNYDPDGDWNPVEQSQPDEREPSGLYKCPGCERLFPNWFEYQKHRREPPPECAGWGDPDATEAGPLPKADQSLFGDGAHYHEMRQEPGITTGHVVVLPARSWKEAARVDGFAKYAKAFSYDNDDYSFYVAYRNGDPLGYVAMGDHGNLHMMHSAVENVGVGMALFTKLTTHYDRMFTHAAHEKTVQLLRRTGWVQVKGQKWRWSKEDAPKDMIEGPLPFIYDIDEDSITMGHPGARTSDIPGRFTPGGIIEGMYEPGGKVVIRTSTSVPYTVRHMVELWYYSQPTLEVKSVYLQDDAGKTTKLARTDVGSTVKTYAAMNPAVQTAADQLMRAGGDVYVVGGAVRDAVMGKEPKDIDLMVTGIAPDQVEALLNSLPGHVVHEGKSFGVFHYQHKGETVEIALPRTEHSTGEGHKDFETQSDHTLTPAQDFERRDFTANAMGINLRNGQLVDPFGGREDISRGVLRTLNDQSLREDPLRVVRALVAHGRHGLAPDETTRGQMADNAAGLRHLPPERIQAELDKIMGSDNPARAIRLAHDTGVLKYILPEVEDAFGYNQNNPHHELELGEHLLNVLDRVSQKTKDPDVRLAALLHDIGKPNSAWKDPETGSNHFYEHHMDDGTVLGADHETLGADMAHKRMNELRYPNERIKRVSDLVQHHMWPAFTTQRGARRLLHRVGDHADDLMDLRWADQGGKSAYPSDPALDLDKQRALIDRVRNQGEATNQSSLAINGNDLINSGITPGPIMGEILRYLTERVVDDPSLNNPQSLLELANEYGTLPQDEALQATSYTAQASKPEAEEVQLSGVRGSIAQKLAEGNEEAEVSWTPSFPDSADAEEVHDQALEDHGQAPEALWNPGGLESAMGRAANYWHYGTGSPGERIADAAGALAHGIGMSQSFVDGNKRTAYHTTRGFLAQNGYEHLSPVEYDDDEFADHLIGHGQSTHSLEDTQQLFRSRLRPEERSQ